MTLQFGDVIPCQELEACQHLEHLKISYDCVDISDHVSSTPPLCPPTNKHSPTVKTAKKKIVIEPTTIRLNKGLRSFDSPRENRVVLDFGSSNLVSSALE